MASVAAAALLVAGCGGSGQSASAPNAPSKVGSTSYPLTITQPDGTKAVIPKAPTRVVTVDNPQQSMDDVAALGVIPVGGLLYPKGTPGYDARGIPTELSSKIGSLTSVGTAPNKPDLQQIVALHPDLIVGVNGAGISDLKQLEAIAPVVSAPAKNSAKTGIDALKWVPEVRLLGHVLGRSAQAETFISQFEAAAAPVRKAISGRTVNLVIPAANGATFTSIGARFQPAGQFLTYLGLKLPESFPGYVKTIGGDHANYSLEHAADLNAQYLMLAHVVSNDTSVYQTFLANPLVANLPAVTAGRVIKTGGDEAIGKGYLTAGGIGQLDALPGIQQALTTTGKPPA